VRWSFALIVLIVLIGELVACSKDVKRDDGPAVAPIEKPRPPDNAASVHIATDSGGDAAVNVEIVKTPATIESGLMFREHLPPDAGMLFLMEVMGEDRDWAFYMRNTLIPLDMIFIGRDMTIAGIVANAEPRTETLRKVGKPSAYVLEVNGGWTGTHHVVAGAKVRFDHVQ
jgi:uncharacterized protein